MQRRTLVVATAVVASTSAVVALKFAFASVVGGESPLLFLAAVMFCAWLGGFRAGLASTLIATAANHYFFTTPFHTFMFKDPATLVRTVAFAGEGLLISAMAGRLHHEARRAELATRARDEFLAVASHELKNPLTTLRTVLGAVARPLNASDDAALSGVRERVVIAQRQVERMVRLVGDLLQIGQVGSGNLRLEREIVDLSQLAADAVALVEEEARLAGSTVTLRAEPSVRGSWDPTRIEQVVMNLLSNALKYGRGTPIEVRVTRDGGFGQLVVHDHGIGIPLEEQAHVFERFARASGTRGTGIQGAGIGLWVVREIVRQHGGDITIESGGASEGSVFTVKLPLIESLEVASRAEPSVSTSTHA